MQPHNAVRLDGKRLAAGILAQATADCAALGFTPGLGVVLVGNDPASHLYVSLKERALSSAGIAMRTIHLAEDASMAEVLNAVRGLNADRDIHAILVQLPLPAHLDEDAVIDAIDPSKDVDGFHKDTLAAYVRGESVIVPGLVAGIMALIASTGVDLAGKRAVVIANSETFARPLKKAFADIGVDMRFAHPDDTQTKNASREADVVVIAIGRARWLKADMVAPGSIVIDVGTNRDRQKIVGDVDYEDVARVAGFISPVPGGVGPLTVAELAKNAIALARARR